MGRGIIEKRELRTSCENKEPEFGVVKVLSETD